MQYFVYKCDTFNSNEIMLCVEDMEGFFNFYGMHTEEWGLGEQALIKINISHLQLA